MQQVEKRQHRGQHAAHKLHQPGAHQVAHAFHIGHYARHQCAGSILAGGAIDQRPAGMRGQCQERSGKQIAVARMEGQFAVEGLIKAIDVVGGFRAASQQRPMRRVTGDGVAEGQHRDSTVFGPGDRHAAPLLSMAQIDHQGEAQRIECAGLPGADRLQMSAAIQSIGRHAAAQRRRMAAEIPEIRHRVERRGLRHRNASLLSNGLA